MIKTMLHKLVSKPTVYHCCQLTIGAGRITDRVAAYVPSGTSRSLDIGAGPGHTRRQFPSEARYFALDSDRAMLSVCKRAHPIQSDATILPILDGSMDMVLLKQVSHHIPEERLDSLFCEIRRVLRPDGRFLFIENVKSDTMISNLLWRYDRGSYPRLEADLQSRLERHFRVVNREVHWHLHQYVLLLLAPLTRISANERSS